MTDKEVRGKRVPQTGPDPIGQMIAKAKMTDSLETRLAQARAEIMPNDVSEMAASHRRAFDAAAAIAREVVAEKDAEIARLESALCMRTGVRAQSVPRVSPEQPRRRGGYAMKWLREYWLIATLMIAFAAAILFAIGAIAVTGDLGG